MIEKHQELALYILRNRPKQAGKLEKGKIKIDVETGPYKIYKLEGLLLSIAYRLSSNAQLAISINLPNPYRQPHNQNNCQAAGSVTVEECITKRLYLDQVMAYR